MEDIAKTIDALTSMITVNNNRIKAYQSLEHKTNQDRLKSVCKLHIDQSKRFIHCLSTWRSAYGGFGISDNFRGTTNTWARMISLLDIGLRRNLWTQCEDQEKDALRLYKAVLESSFIADATRSDIHDHVKGLEKALATIKHFSERPEVVHSTAVHS
jgi:hypothetical protein